MPGKSNSKDPNRPVNLKMLAEYLDLSPATVSFVLNDAPNRSIPEHTRERVRAAAKKFNYQPSLIARSLQGKRTQTVGILLSSLADPRQAELLAGAADIFLDAGFLFFTAQHAGLPDRLKKYPQMLIQRGVEGFFLIDTPLTESLGWPTVSVDNTAATTASLQTQGAEAARLLLEKMKTKSE